MSHWMPSNMRRKPKGVSSLISSTLKESTESHLFQLWAWYCCCLPGAGGAGWLSWDGHPQNRYYCMVSHTSSQPNWEQTVWNMQNKTTSVTLNFVRGRISSKARGISKAMRLSLKILIFHNQTLISKYKEAFENSLFCSSLLVHECKSHSCLSVAVSQKWPTSFCPNCSQGLSSWADVWVMTLNFSQLLKFFPPPFLVTGNKTSTFPVSKPHNWGTIFVFSTT